MEEQYYRKEKSKFKPWLYKILRKKTVLFSLLIGLPVLSFMLFSNKGIIQRLSLESDKKAVQAKLKQIQFEQQKLLKELKALEDDPKAIEKVAREKFGMIKDGETVYKIKKAQP
ncbi:MAG: septum formation initiator family protein [Ignavibacteriales bacterium]|nr:septum formation initiator family protein [Ignavibacteriales bacterium]